MNKNFNKIKNNNLKNIVFYIKNISIIASFMASIIGGLIQGAQLFYLGTMYLKFFSITQLIGDTLSVMFPLLFVISYGIISFNAKNSKNENWHDKYVLVVFNLVVFLLLFGFLERINLIERKYSVIVFAVLTFIFIISNIKYFNNKSNILRRIYDFVFKEIQFYLISLFLVLFLIISGTPNEISEKFVNKKNICKDLNANECQIKYFNDKYIFAEIGKDDNKKIKVLKFDKFFEN